MIALIISFASGAIFAVGLSISQMINPYRVKGFLDIFGNWDYSLAFVMAGAVLFNLFAFKFIKSKKPLCSEAHFWPEKKDVDKRLIVGAVLFGVGWGLIGICPGPAIVNLVTLKKEAFIFVLSMIAGMYLFKLSEKKV